MPKASSNLALKSTGARRFNRRTGIGSSAVSALLGMNPRKTKFELWLECTGRVKSFKRVDPGESPDAYWGKRLEKILREEYNRRLAQRSPTARIVKPRTVAHEDYPWLFASLDGIRLDIPKTWEAKTTNVYQFKRDEWGEPGTAQIPNHHRAQVEVGMAVWRATSCTVSVLVGGAQYHEYEVPANLKLRKRVIDMVRAFWHDHVEKDVPPDVQANDYGLIEEYLPAHDPKLDYAEASAKTTQLALLLKIEREFLASHGERAKALGSQLKIIIGDAPGVKGDQFGRIDYKQNKPSTVTDWEALAFAYRKLLETKPGRRNPTQKKLDTLMKMFTTEREGNRPFTPRWKEDGNDAD